MLDTDLRVEDGTTDGGGAGDSDVLGGVVLVNDRFIDRQNLLFALEGRAGRRGTAAAAADRAVDRTVGKTVFYHSLPSSGNLWSVVSPG